MLTFKSQDEDEDWSRWRDVVFRAKGALTPKSFHQLPPLPPQNRRRRGGRSSQELMPADSDHGQDAGPSKETDSTERAPTPPQLENAVREQLASDTDAPAPSEPGDSAQLTLSEASSRMPSLVGPDPEVDSATGTLYCPECYLPLHPDPKPEKLYIFLHALKYELRLGCFETEMPEWAKEGWEWERDQG